MELLPPIRAREDWHCGGRTGIPYLLPSLALPPILRVSLPLHLLLTFRCSNNSTGAGKSSLFLALFRIVRSIYVDKVNIARIVCPLFYIALVIEFAFQYSI